MKTVYVLWYLEYDGSGSEIYRVYMDRDDAEDDLKLLVKAGANGVIRISDSFLYEPRTEKKDA